MVLVRPAGMNDAVETTRPSDLDEPEPPESGRRGRARRPGEREGQEPRLRRPPASRHPGGRQRGAVACSLPNSPSTDFHAASSVAASVARAILPAASSIVFFAAREMITNPSS